MNTLIKNASILNEGKIFEGSVWIEDEIIRKIYTGEDETPETPAGTVVIDAQKKILMPGVIDEHVHFREPGLTHKGDIFSESRAAAAGGVTSFMDMPNTVPPTVTLKSLEEKYTVASHSSLINYSFYLGATNRNIDAITKIDPKKVCGVKVFLCSVNKKLLVNDDNALSAIFAESPVTVVIHSEDEHLLNVNTRMFKGLFHNNVPACCHIKVRSEEACYKSTDKVVKLALKYNTRAHLLHLSTAKELTFFERCSAKYMPRLTAETCVSYLWFDESDYWTQEHKIKCNPSIKTLDDKNALREAVRMGRIAVVASDHAPHTFDEKQGTYFDVPSGMPVVQHSLSAMIEMHRQRVFSLFEIVDRMCHSPARLFKIRGRGYIREGYFADMTLVDMNKSYFPCKNNIFYKCGWSPFEGTSFSTSVEKTWVNGSLVYDNGQIIEANCAKRLEFGDEQS
ncbi:MAG: dihydroorotase [Prevotellaceae bacterium]|jgi:dihydroorotase|nr:dihydroorotase [Prevotellaceae bacterium]